MNYSNIFQDGLVWHFVLFQVYNDGIKENIEVVFADMSGLFRFLTQKIRYGKKFTEFPSMWRSILL